MDICKECGFDKDRPEGYLKDAPHDGPSPDCFYYDGCHCTIASLAYNTNSAPKRLRDKRKFKDICNACLSFVEIGPSFLPFTRDGEPIRFGKFDGDKDTLSGCYVHYSVARLDKGIPNPKVRPVLPTPWEIRFDFKLYPNKEIQEQEIINLFEDGGRALGLGTFRGLYGKFIVREWV